MGAKHPTHVQTALKSVVFTDYKNLDGALVSLFTSQFFFRFMVMIVAPTCSFHWSNESVVLTWSITLIAVVTEQQSLRPSQPPNRSAVSISKKSFTHWSRTVYLNSQTALTAHCGKQTTPLPTNTTLHLSKCYFFLSFLRHKNCFYAFPPLYCHQRDVNWESVDRQFLVCKIFLIV